MDGGRWLPDIEVDVDEGPGLSLGEALALAQTLMAACEWINRNRDSFPTEAPTARASMPLFSDPARIARVMENIVAQQHIAAQLLRQPTSDAPFTVYREEGQL